MSDTSKIPDIRMQKGLSRAAFANSLGVSASKITNIENKRQRADHEFLIKLAKIYNIDVNILLGLEGDLNNIQKSNTARSPEYDVSASAGAGAQVDDEVAIGFHSFKKTGLINAAYSLIPYRSLKCVATAWHQKSTILKILTLSGVSLPACMNGKIKPKSAKLIVCLRRCFLTARIQNTQ